MYLKGLEIEEHRDKQTKECSGGTKRKLSYIISMLGKLASLIFSKITFLLTYDIIQDFHLIREIPKIDLISCIVIFFLET